MVESTDWEIRGMGRRYRGCTVNPTLGGTALAYRNFTLVESSYGASDAAYAARASMSSAFKLATTFFMSAEEVPVYWPV